MYKTILVPLDGSRRAEAILPYVEELACRFHSRVIFLRVVEPVPVMSGSHEAYAGVYLDQVQHYETEIENYLRALRGEFREKQIEAEGVVEHGPVVEAICRSAEYQNADLIALASHGYSGLSRVYYGSTASGLLQRIDRPLLLIRATD
jgi:nucleotide-binding universal stress UspA family protein